MSRQLIEFPLENGKSIFVEENLPDGMGGAPRGESEASWRGDVIREKVNVPFQEAMEVARDGNSRK